MKESMKCFWLIVPVPMEGESRFLFQDKLVCNFFLDLNPKSRLNDYFYSVLRLGYSIATLPPPLRPFTHPKCIFNCSTKFADILPCCEKGDCPTSEKDHPSLVCERGTYDRGCAAGKNRPSSFPICVSYMQKSVNIL